MKGAIGWWFWIHSRQGRLGRIAWVGAKKVISGCAGPCFRCSEIGCITGNVEDHVAGDADNGCFGVGSSGVDDAGGGAVSDT